MLFSSSSSDDDDDWSSEASDENDERSESDVENEKLQQAKKQKRVPKNEQPSITPPKGPQPKKTPKCVICLDEIEKPTATKCGHVYCDQCIREWIRAQPRERKSLLKKRQKEKRKKYTIHTIYITRANNNDIIQRI